MVQPLASNEMIVWWGTPVECFSAFAPLRREAVLDHRGEDRARAFVADLAAAWAEIQPGTLVREGAGRVLRLHHLRAADALQLAAALIWAGGRPEVLDFVCLDHRLREAARQEGFKILPAARTSNR